MMEDIKVLVNVEKQMAGGDDAAESHMSSVGEASFVTKTQRDGKGKGCRSVGRLLLDDSRRCWQSEQAAATPAPPEGSGFVLV